MCNLLFFRWICRVCVCFFLFSFANFGRFLPHSNAISIAFQSHSTRHDENDQQIFSVQTSNCSNAFSFQIFDTPKLFRFKVSCTISEKRVFFLSFGSYVGNGRCKVFHWQITTRKKTRLVWILRRSKNRVLANSREKSIRFVSIWRVAFSATF